MTARLATAAIAAALIPAAAAVALPVADYTEPAARDTEPVVLTGKDVPEWAAPQNANAKLPLTDLGSSEHNHYAEPEVESANVAAPEGTPIDRLLAYRWHPKPKKFVRIPFQVDEVFTRYLDNSASGFALYSGQDQHTTYAFDREGFRWTESHPDDPCLAQPDSPVAKDPVRGLDTNDELVFMASDAGPQAPADAELPKRIEEMRAVRVTDPTDPTAERFVYLMKAEEKGPRSDHGAQEYVSYERDANADLFEKSESSYSDYGNARRGIVCDADGNVVTNADGTPRLERRRPRDYATIATDRYRFRYDGRWLMTKVEISPDEGRSYGPDVVDRWKARAFQQDPSSDTPCCGYEEEDTNWGGSSTLLGERVGPVRAIRETWGADSGTNVIRRETFYREEVRQKNWLRVHVIPPLDGIYAQWDFNAGRMTRYYNSARPDGVDVDGSNDEVFGNFDDPCNGLYDSNDTSDTDQGYRSLYRQTGLCDFSPYHQSVDVADPTMGELNAGFQWNVIAGPWGSIVNRYQLDEVTDLTPGGAAQQVAAVPYYRDDSCFDDGTGSDPGPRVRLRQANEARTYVAEDGTTRERTCWQPADGIPDGSQRHFQGSIATHGLHLLFLAESDNARLQAPLTEIVAEQRLVMLPGERGAEAGERYGRGFEKPLAATVLR